MTAAAGFTSGVKLKVFLKEAQAIADTATHATLTGATGFNISGSTNLLNFVTDLGDLTQGANNLTFNVYGEGSQRSVAGFATQEDFTLTFAIDEANTLHTGLMDKAIGSNYGVGLLITTSAAAETLMAFEAQLSGKAQQNPADGVRSQQLTFAITKAPKRFAKA